MSQAKTDVKTGSRLVCRPCDSWNVNKTSVREESRGWYLPKGSVFLSFSELFDNISPVLKVKRLCVVEDSLIYSVPPKCVIVRCDFRMVLTGRTQVCVRVVELFRQNILCQP